ncbi:MAG: DUF3638 domain-containing protein, partial [Parachlamydiaceae bacterium]
VVDATPANYRLEPHRHALPDQDINLTPSEASSQNLIDFIDRDTVSVTPPMVRRSPQQRAVAGWLLAQSEQAEINRVQQTEFSRLEKDYNEFTQQPAPPTYEIKDTKNIKTSLNHKLVEQKADLGVREKTILERANKLPDDSFKSAQHLLQQMGGKAKIIVMDDILSSLAQNNSKKLRELNPFLDDTALKELYDLAADFLLLSIRDTQKDKALALCEDIEKTHDPGKKEELIQQLGEVLHTKRAYDPAKRPAFLVFEYYADIMMRPDQVGKLEEFLNGNESNLVMEMIMGSGKSKVLMPLLGLMRADGQKLSMLIVPSPLFTSIASDTQESLQKNFDQSLKSLFFDRGSTFTVRSLEKIKETLNSTIENKECLIMTSRSMESLALKFVDLNKEYLSTTNKSTEMTEKVRLMADILRIFKSQGLPLIDEADTVLNILHEVSFSNGEKEPPKTCHIQTVGLFYEILYTDTKFKSLISLESDPNRDDKVQSGLTAASYRENIQKTLAEAFIEKLRTASIDIETDLALKPYLENLKQGSIGEQQLLQFLCRDADHANDAQKYFDGLPPQIQEVIALASEEISQILPHTLEKVSDVNYGLSEGPVAIPFAAANKPNLGSIFANPFVTMNFTIQAHFKKGVGVDAVKAYVKKLQEQVKLEGVSDLSQSKAWKTFQMLKGDLNLPLRNISAEEIKQLTDAINEQPLAKLLFIKNALLPQVEVYPSKISCTAIDLTSFFDLPVCGFTGTLWNGSSFDKKMELLFAAGTDAETIDLLWNRSDVRKEVLRPGTSENLLQQLKSLAPHCIIDVGGYFKGEGTTVIAHQMAKQLNKPVLYYDEQGNQKLTNEQSVSLVPPGERATLYDQSRTVGADVKQADDALGVLTVGRSMLLRDLLQGAWRLRGLRKQQKITFIIDAEVDQIMRQSLGLGADRSIEFSHILEFTVKNQAERQGNDAFKAFTQQLEGLKKSLLYNVLLDTKLDLAQKEKAFELLKNSWFQDENQSCAITYGSIVLPEKSPHVLAVRAQEFLASLESLKIHLPFLSSIIEEMQSQVNEIHERAKNCVHETILSPRA